MRKLSFGAAISEATVQSMEQNPNVCILGAGVADPKGIFNTTLEAKRRFGKKRVLEVPLSENSILGAAIGMAIAGKHPLIVHARNDFLMLCMDQLVNQMAKWNYMSNGQCPIGITIRAIIGRGWGQGPQHSQSLQALFSHIPGLKVVMPGNAYDAKGLLMTALSKKSPVIYLEHRWLHAREGEVPKEPYSIPLGTGKILKEGKDATLVAISHMVLEALEAADLLSKRGIEIEVIDLRTVSPLDKQLIFASVKKTGNLVVADTGWGPCGVSAEICALVAEEGFRDLKNAPRRITLPYSSTPCSPHLEKHFYPGALDISQAIEKMLTGKSKTRLEVLANRKPEEKIFRGPF